MEKTTRTWRSHFLVFLQLSGVALCVWPVGLTNRGPVIALVLCALGAVLGLFALSHNRIGASGVYPELPDQAGLITSGPYRFMRHPMYSGLMLMTVGIALFNLHLLNLVGVAAVVLAVVGKVSIEERDLAARFPQYARYAAQTPRFLPRLP